MTRFGRCGDAATLVNRDIDNDRSWSHCFHHVFGDDDRCLIAGDEYGANDEICIGDTPCDR